jgi:hypothetical protein
VADLPAHSKHHLDYEIWMLVESAQAWHEGLPKPVRNAVTEAFAIHLRNLIMFLDPKSERCGDVFARDFFTTPGRWVPPAFSEDLQKALERAHREIAHLTVDRTPGYEKGKEWDPKLIDDLVIHFKRFVELADQDRLHPDVKARVLALPTLRRPVSSRAESYLEADPTSRPFPYTTS